MAMESWRCGPIAHYRSSRGWQCAASHIKCYGGIRGHRLSGHDNLLSDGRLLGDYWLRRIGVLDVHRFGCPSRTIIAVVPPPGGRQSWLRRIFVPTPRVAWAEPVDPALRPDACAPGSRQPPASWSATSWAAAPTIRLISMRSASASACSNNAGRLEERQAFRTQ